MHNGTIGSSAGQRDENDIKDEPSGVKV